MSILLVAIVVGLVIGFVTVPGAIRLLGSGIILNSVFGNGMLILAQLAKGGTLAYARESGETDLIPYDADENRAYIDGEWTELDSEPTVYRLAWRPFAIAPELSPQALSGYHVDADSIDSSDSGVALLGERRGGYPLFTSYTDVAGGYVVDVVKYLRDVGRDGNRLLNRAQEIALREYGGDSQLSQTWFAMMMLAATIVMFVITFGMLAVMG